MNKKLLLIPIHQNGLNYSEYLKKSTLMHWEISAPWTESVNLEDTILYIELLFPNGQKGVCGADTF